MVDVAVAPSDAAAPPRRGAMLAVLLVAWFMAQFDFFVVNVAAPTLSHQLGASPAALELVVGGYAFTYAAGMITGGRLGDRWGQRRMFTWGMVAFTAASILCGLARDPGQLVAFRLLQGLAGAAMVPQVLAVITSAFPAAERPRALGWYGLTGGVASIAGQVLGGFLLDANVFGLGWRSIFLINLPIGLITVPLAARLLPARRHRAPARLDPAGAVGVAVTLGLFLVPLGLGNSQGWPPWTWLCLAAAVPLGAATLLWQRRLHRRGGQPILELELFGAPSYRAGLAAMVGFMAYWASFTFTLSLLLQNGFRFTAFEAGLAFLPLGLAFSVSALWGARLVKRVGLRLSIWGGGLTLLGLAGLLATLLLTDGTPRIWWVVPALFVVSFGNGFLLPPLMGAALVDVRADQAGIGSGMLVTTQQFSQSAGTAVIGAVFFAALGTATGTGAYAAAMVRTTVIDLGLLAAVVAMVVFLKRATDRAGA